jgi:hypothetical protein
VREAGSASFKGLVASYQGGCLGWREAGGGGTVVRFRRRPWRAFVLLGHEKRAFVLLGFYRRWGREGEARRGTIEGGVAEPRPQQGRGIVGASSLGHRESTAAWCARVGHGQIQSRGGRFDRGLVVVLPFGEAHRQASLARWLVADRSRRDRIGEREEREGRERKSEGPGSMIFISKFCKEILKI